VSVELTAAPLQGLRVRAARAADAGAVARAVRELLLELGGEAPSVERMQGVASALIDDAAAGTVLVAEADGELAGVLAASWQAAIHVPGAYALIQDLWVDPDRRSQAVGRELLAALVELARARNIRRVEVGLPRESFARFAATEAFYLANGFTANGPRMRMVLA
jgi:GNAT superfamily N-acetyltransferase